ncbi:MAG: peptide deformylase [Phycisphaerae bacterium]|nr:peptide deformylase [Phycisphaerae bacterium]
MPVDPATLYLVTYPHPALRVRSKPIDKVTDEVRAVALRMIELMKEEEGIGLAANQVGLAWRLFVAHVPDSDDPADDRSLLTDPISATRSPTVYINPVFSLPQRDLVPFDEGCLSLPDIRGEVRRPSQVTLTYTDLEGHRATLRASGLLARCWQHEMDHLDGTLIIDRMLQIDRMKNRAAIRDLEERYERKKPL